MPTRDPIFELNGKRIFVAGHRGMVGAAIVRRLASEDCQLLIAGRETADLTRQNETEDLIAEIRPDCIIVAAAKVGGILANSRYPADFIYQNLAIEMNLVEAARRAGVPRLVMLGSSCIYPKHAPQPIPEAALLTGPLESTNEWYAVAKIAGLKLVDAYRKQYGLAYISAMPSNLYGPGDNFDLESSHVLPALLRKVHEAKAANAPAITIWGTGSVRREFLHADDCADAIVHLLKNYDGDGHVNVGSGGDLSITELAALICEVVGYAGDIRHDLSKPDGTPRKLMDSSRLRDLGWRPRIRLREGVASTYRWFLDNFENRRS